MTTTQTQNEIRDIIKNALDHLNDFDMNLLGDLGDFADSDEPLSPNEIPIFTELIGNHDGYIWAIMHVAAVADVFNDFDFSHCDDELHNVLDKYNAKHDMFTNHEKNEVYNLWNEMH